jgi:prophage regulatory protein
MATLNRLLRRPAVEDASGLSRSTIYRRIKDGLFPRPVSIGTDKNGESCTVAWIADEIAAVNAARIAGKSEADIKALVVELEAARTQGA